MFYDRKLIFNNHHVHLEHKFKNIALHIILWFWTKNILNNFCYILYIYPLHLNKEEKNKCQPNLPTIHINEMGC